MHQQGDARDATGGRFLSSPWASPAGEGIVKLQFSKSRRAYMPVVVKAGLESVLRKAPARIRSKLSGPLLVRDVTLVAERR